MQRYSLTHLPNEVLRHELTNKTAKEKEATAELLAHIAEFDARKLYLPAAYPSMLDYCTKELGFSEEAAKKRIRVARAGRACPAVLEALASGRVHLSGLVVLAKHLSSENAGEMLAAATGKSREEIECLVAERFPRLDVAAQVMPIHATRRAVPSDQRSPGTVDLRARTTPLSPEAYAVQFTRNREQDERFRYLQDLLGHQVSRGDLADVYDRAVRELIAKMERVRFGACAKPRTGRHRASTDSRYVPAHVKREVWLRDQGRCTFESESGRRCEARGDVEFDHVKEFARGGEATVGNLRLRCRGHNQHTAERTFGAGFMRQKRAQAAAAPASQAPAAAVGPEQPDPEDDDVIRALRTLGYRAEESRRAVALCDDMPDAPPEARLRRALTYFPVRGKRVIPAANEGPSFAPPGAQAV